MRPGRARRRRSERPDGVGGKPPSPATGAWPTQQLAEFLALISCVNDEGTATRRGIERVAEVLDAQGVALVRGGRVIAAVGFAEGELPAEPLVAVADGSRGTLAVPGAGECEAIAVPLEDERPLHLVVARRPERPFRSEELGLLRGMGRVLTLGLRNLRLLENERALRSGSERQASENARLLGALRDRQVLLERLAQLQRGIVDRLPVHEVLETAAEGACELLGDEVGVLRLIDPDDPSHTMLVASIGADRKLLTERRHQPIGAGLGGRAMRERGVVLADALSGIASPEATRDFPADGLTAAMAAPVHERGKAVGSLGVGSRQPGREYGSRDQQVLLSFAEHASLALNHARAVEEAVHEALHDSLTGLPNRSLFVDRLRHSVARAERAGTPVAVLFCDLDGFKTVNDSLGHRTGDRLLVSVAERLAGCLRPTDTIARLGGDEFAVLLEELREPGDAARAAQRLLDSLEPPFELREREFFISASIGIATGTKEAETLLRNADLAMYRAKNRGKGRYAIFEPGMHTAIVERLDLEVDLKGAIERDELVLAYQPIFSLRSGAVAGVEALVRWRHPTRGLVLPEQFVPLAEESGVIRELGRWVLRTACHQGALWRAKYPGHPGLQIGVNVSGAQLREPGLVEEVAEALATAQLDASGLTLEITETALMGSFEPAIEQLDALKRLGVDLAIDDFGIGYSSLRYLRRLPLDSLKIEKSFVDGIGRSNDEPALLRAIVDLADIFGLAVIAEGIERPEQRQRLIELGCDFGQGHLLSESLDTADADALLFRVGLLGGPAPASATPAGGDEPSPATIEPKADRGAD
jgi:diguanylate cyclase (GGDEF)-like protein